MVIRLIFLIVLAFPGMFTFAQEVDQLILDREYSRALDLLNRKLETAQTAGLYYKKGIVCVRLTDYPEAVKALTEACRLDQQSVMYLEELAETHSAMRNYTDAVPALRRAALLDPSNRSIKGKLAQSLNNLKEYQEAFRLYEQIYQQDSTNLYYNRYFAFCAWQTENFELAVKLYEELAGQGCRDLNVYLNLATLYHREKESLKAIAACTRGLQVFPDHPAFFFKARGDQFSEQGIP